MNSMACLDNRKTDHKADPAQHEPEDISFVYPEGKTSTPPFQ
jgi:hypothetical protein